MSFNTIPNQTSYEITKEFGFQNGGTYSINIKSNGTEKYFFYIDLKQKMEEFKNEYNLKNFSCNISIQPNQHIIQIEGGSGKIASTIKKEGLYTSIIRSCTPFNEGCKITLILKNPNSCLSIKDQQYRKIFLITSIISLLLFILWVLNWINFFSFKNKINLLLSLFVLYNFFENYLIFYDFNMRHLSDDVKIDTTYLFYAIFIGRFIYTFALLLTHLGDGILYESLHYSIYIICFIIDFVYSFFVAQIEYNIIFGQSSDKSFLVFTYFIQNHELHIEMTYINVFLFIWNALLISFAINLYSEDGKTYFYVYLSTTIIINNVIYAVILMLNMCLQIASENALKAIQINKNVFLILLLYQMRYRKFITDNYMKLNMKYYNFDMDKNDIIPYIQFWGDSVDKVSIPSHIKEIERSAFSYCHKLERVDFESNSRLQKIGSHCFSGTNIKNIVIPSDVKLIEPNVFDYCKSLQKVDFYDDSKLIAIKSEAFCFSSIDSLTIPAHVKYLIEGWCNETPKLNVIKLSRENNYFLYYDNSFIVGKRSNKGILYFARRNIVKAQIPSFIKKISTQAFGRCKSLRKVIFGIDSKLKVINDSAFIETSIVQITIPQSVIQISKSAFSNCKNLRNVFFMDNSKLANIEMKAFEYTSIREISIPSKVSIIDEYAFSNCRKLKKVKFDSNSEMKMIGKNAFEGTSITSFAFPSETIKIGFNVFYKCNHLKIVEMPSFFSIFDLVKSIFYGCPNVQIMVH
ncbi:hypothetical protein M9Y10_000534 [Tritrichomonas musculus]|uniref:Uncharacterized protein n=1 Tax=Tritrichomonas musculus TaxID=1915356 RepID=A0ABR2L4H3_9EUKA